jgi:hypothetical protein
MWIKLVRYGKAFGSMDGGTCTALDVIQYRVSRCLSWEEKWARSAGDVNRSHKPDRVAVLCF